MQNESILEQTEISGISEEHNYYTQIKLNKSTKLTEEVMLINEFYF